MLAENHFNSCVKKQQKLIDHFASCNSNEDKYKQIIEYGKKLPILEPEKRTPAAIVPGCQSVTYLHAHKENGLVYFSAYAEALISAGLASILFEVYSAELPETVLTYPPDFLQLLGLQTALTPSRSNGLYSIHLKMKQEALKLLI